jgi:hypothetical protein
MEEQRMDPVNRYTIEEQVHGYSSVKNCPVDLALPALHKLRSDEIDASRNANQPCMTDAFILIRKPPRASIILRGARAIFRKETVSRFGM